jgi:hypothetical protein
VVAPGESIRPTVTAAGTGRGRRGFRRSGLAFCRFVATFSSFVGFQPTMKLTRSSLLGAMLLVVTPLFASSRDSAFLAQYLLGPQVWSRVVKIESAPMENSRYPAEFHGLVIAFADILWFYTEFDGTQNLSPRRGQVAMDEANLGELLRTIHPGMIRFTAETDAPALYDLPQVLPNACFVACLKYWAMLEESGRPPKHVRLIACFPSDSPIGHMILEYRRGLRRFVFDPDRPGEQIPIPFWANGSALSTATRALQPRWRSAPHRVTSVDLGRPVIMGPVSKNLIAATPPAERSRF